MLPYGCLATGEKSGFIEVVQDSETIANIQKLRKKGKGLWDSHLLLDWLKERNPDPTQWVLLQQAHYLSSAALPLFCVASPLCLVAYVHVVMPLISETYETGLVSSIQGYHFRGSFVHILKLEQ